MSLSNFIKKANTKTKICLTLLLLLLFLNVKNGMLVDNTKIEGYKNKDKSKKKAKYYFNDTIYDDFYVNIYDKLLFNDNKIRYETKELIEIININNNSIILDIGCGLGHHCKVFKDNKAKCVGLDKSEAVIKRAKKNYPDCKFVKGDAKQMNLFDKEHFNVITTFYFSIYYFKDKHIFFKNCAYWLKPGGYLAIHLVDRDKFNPIIPAGDPLSIVSPQKYAKKRIDTSLVTFNNYKYKSQFLMNSKNKDNVTFKETFKFKDNTYRINEHKMYMEHSKQILSIAQKYGFSIIAKIDLLLCHYDYQYVYILQK